MSFWVAGAAVVGTLGGAVISSQGANKAAKIAAGGGDAASAEAGRQFDIIRGDNLGRINIGNQAVNALGSIYGYSPNVGAQPNPVAGASPYSPTQASRGPMNSGAGSIFLNPATPGLGAANYVFNPAGALFNAFGGNKHGDEKRNLSAFTSQNQIYDLGNGMLSLADGTQFPKDQLQQVAGAWYGANYHPDGDQAGWQQKYGALIKPPANVGQAGGGLTSDGVPQGFTAGQGMPAASGPQMSNPLTSPDYTNFFKSPDYTFRRDEGTRGIENSFSASGGAKSGNALKALAEFNSNLAAGGFNDYRNGQLALAGLGQVASGQSGSAGIATGQIVGNALQNSADARASGVAGQYNAIGQGVSGLAQGLGYYLQNRNRQQPYNPYSNYGMNGYGG